MIYRRSVSVFSGVDPGVSNPGPLTYETVRNVEQEAVLKATAVRSPLRRW